MIAARACRTRWLALLLAALAGPVAAQQDHPVREDLQHLKRDLARERRLVRRLERQSTSLLSVLGEMDAAVERAERELAETEQRLAALEREQAALHRQQAQAARSLETLRARLLQRLRAIYMQGRNGWLNLIFGADSIAQGLRRHQLLLRLARADQRLARQVARSRDRLAETEARLEQQRRELEQIRQQVVERREAAAAARDEQRAGLAIIQRKASLRKRAVAEMRRARKRLSGLVSSIQGSGERARGFASWRGRLPSPLPAGRVEVGFGRQVDRRFGTATRHQGVDLRAPRGTPVRAIYPGTVVFARVFEGYGRLVILDHGGDYYSLYGHLDRLAVERGQRIDQSQPVGTLGASGSLRGPYLYFELRRGERALDPSEWVRF